MPFLKEGEWEPHFTSLPRLVLETPYRQNSSLALDAGQTFLLMHPDLFNPNITITAELKHH